MRAGISENTPPAAVGEVDCHQIIDNRLLVCQSPLDAEVEAPEAMVKEVADRIRSQANDDSIKVETKVIASVSEAGAILGEAHATGACGPTRHADLCIGESQMGRVAQSRTYAVDTMGFSVPRDETI